MNCPGLRAGRELPQREKRGISVVHPEVDLGQIPRDDGEAESQLQQPHNQGEMSTTQKTRLVRLGFSWLGLSRLGLTWLGLAGWLGLTYPCLALTFLVLYPTRIHLAIGTTAWCVKTTGLDTGPRSAASTSSKILTIYARPTKTPHNATETHRIVRAMATQ